MALNLLNRITGGVVIVDYFHYTDVNDIATYALHVLQTEIDDQLRVVDPHHFCVSHGTTEVSINLISEDEYCVISIQAPIAFHVPATAQVFEYLAMNSDRLGLPVFSVTESGHPGMLNVYLSHRILGNCLDRGELLASMYAVAHLSDTLDEEFVGRFGGLRWIDMHKNPV